ncbi:MAG: ATP-binding cassette domain-containing protein [Candidatus Melainabacteria bacterium]|nr:ATP-binding cassette domain-containing protein [Candidatus Melainabacteria bacterium]
MTEPLLLVQDLCFAYRQGAGGDAPAVEAISFALVPGEIVCILGPSGCGKTTLLNLIAGLLQPTSGSIKFSNEQIAPSQSSQSRTRIGYIFQHDVLLPWRTVRSNLMLANDLRKSAIDQKELDEYLKTFHLETSILDRYPSQLSGGMRQRVGIIQALMFDPEILLLDEPFSALDFYTKLRLESEFHSLARASRKGTLLVTHDIDEAIAMGDRVILMDRSGKMAKEIAIDLGEGEVSPDKARGHESFSGYYNDIFSHLEESMAL